MVCSAIAFFFPPPPETQRFFPISQMQLKAPFTRRSHYGDMMDPEAQEAIKGV